MCRNPHSRGLMTFLCMLQVMVHVAHADYQVGFIISDFSHPSNTLANDSCCVHPSCGECGVTLRLCFRDAGHPQADTDSSCSLLQFNRNYPSMITVFGTDREPIEGSYPGGFQIYVRVSHCEDRAHSDFDPPFTDPLIDDVFIEVEASAVAYEDRNSPSSVAYEVTGENGKATISLRVNVHCAEGYSGPDCNTVLNLEISDNDDDYEESSEGEEDVVPIVLGSILGGVVVPVLVVVGVIIACCVSKSSKCGRNRTVWKSKYEPAPPALSETNLHEDTIENPYTN